jgi:N-formylglutamate amidohydrolase
MGGRLRSCINATIGFEKLGALGRSPKGLMRRPPNGEIKMVGEAEELRHSLPLIAVLHIPHSSRQVPAGERGAIRLDDRALEFELLRMTDAYTDVLFPSTPVEAARLVFPVSRLVCDVERFQELRMRTESMETTGFTASLVQVRRAALTWCET